MFKLNQHPAQNYCTVYLQYLTKTHLFASRGQQSIGKAEFWGP